MKKVFLIFVVFYNLTFAIFDCARCQWLQQPTGTTMNLNNVKFINKNTGWVCGDGGILKTTNGGNNWVMVTLPVNKPLEQIFPIDSNIVYCVGVFETIIKTTNGGTNWQIIRDGAYGTTSSYFCCHFINRNTGWITGGADRKIMKTTNGCGTFDSIVTTTSGFIYDIYFRDSLTGLYCDNNGAVRKTTNGGYNWFTINIPVGSFSYTFRNFSFINNQTGWLVEYSRKLFKTTDFGSNWDSISNIPNGSYGIHCVSFSSANIGWAAGEGFLVFKSTNGGVNWFSQTGNGGHSIYFVNDTVGWEVANLGKIFHTENGGGLMSISNYEGEKIKDFALHQNYPNPFNAVTKIEFDITKQGSYKLEIYDLLGRRMESVFSKQLSPGKYEYSYNAEKLSSGTYFYRLQSGSFVHVKRMVLNK
jgi:photosystem II stability/assembly factor-like uncharacterized protein